MPVESRGLCRQQLIIILTYNTSEQVTIGITLFFANKKFKTNIADEATLHALHDLFPVDDNYIEECEFSNLHKIILGLSSQSLETCVATHPNDIDSQDFLGNSALIWATRRNDINAVRVLLDVGANPNIQDGQGGYALSYAARYSKLQCIRLLLSAGADVHLRDCEGQSPLHYLSTRWIRQIQPEDEKESILCLVTAGSDVEKRSIDGSTPLAAAAFSDLPITLEALLDCGADIESQDNEGDCAIHNALFRNSEGALSVLLRRGADYTRWISTGNSILHQAAISGSLDMIEILMAAGLHDVDPDAPNRQGHTALELAQQREEKPDGFVHQVRLLLADVRSRNASMTLEVESDGPRHHLRAQRNARRGPNPHSDRSWNLSTRYYSILQQLRMIPSQTWSHATILPKAFRFVQWRTLLSLRTVLLVLCFAWLMLWIHWIFRMRWTRSIVVVVWNLAGPRDFEL